MLGCKRDVFCWLLTGEWITFQRICPILMPGELPDMDPANGNDELALLLVSPFSEL